jgi:c-di-GMP-binding flagellar brake protein YcgR
MPPEMAGAPELGPDQPVNLRVSTADGLHTLHTTVHRVDLPSGRVTVGWPMADKRLLPVAAGQVVMVEVSPGDALYRREVLIESATTEEPPTLVLLPISDWQRLQRRQAVRYPLELRPTTAARLLPSGEAKPFDAVMRDLSTGGIRLATSVELQIGDVIELSFGTPSGGAELWLRVSVVRTDGSNVGCHFLEPSASEREHIVQFILAQQAAAARS